MNQQKLQRYIEGKASPEERKEVAYWLDANEQNREEFKLLHYIYDATLWSDEMGEVTKRQLLRRKSSRFVRECLKIAAIFLIAFGLYTRLLPHSIEEEAALAMKTIYVPEGQRAEITLTDGSHVWLNAQTRLSFPEQFTEDARRVVLDGEAYFDVAPDATKQFVVHTNRYNVTVLGTEFNVMAYQRTNYFETSLIEGSVEITSDSNKERLLLTPETRAYTKNNQLVKGSISNHDAFLWREGTIAFENELVKDIFNKLELYYDVRIDIQNTGILNHHYTGKFRTKDGIEHVLKVLQLRHKFTYTKDNETNIITIK